MKCPICGKDMILVYDGDLGKSYVCPCGHHQDISYSAGNPYFVHNTIQLDWMQGA